MSRRLKIAMVGTRGVPATFGGVEHHVEELGARLVERGHHVTVFCRANYGDQTDLSEYRGMQLVYQPTIRAKHLEAIVHSGVATLSAMRSPFDVIHYHAIGPGAPSPIPRYLSKKAVVQTIHGLDGERAKWGSAASTMLRGATWLSAKVPDATIVVSRALGEHYELVYGRECVYIPNGVSPKRARQPNVIATKYGLSAGGYVLFVGRLVPEKNVDLLLRAFRDVPGDRRLVIAGGSSYTDEYSETLRELASLDERVIMTGYVYGEELDELYTNAAVFVIPSALEGLPLTLLEAIGSGIPVIASDLPAHTEVIKQDGPGARLVGVNDEAALTAAIANVLERLDDERAGAEAITGSVLQHYNWDLATDMLESTYLDVII